MTPKEKTEQIEKGDNEIVEFWRVRGYEIVKTALGISFSLHRKPEYENRGLGLNLQYLEQFYSEAQEKALDIILELIKVEKVTRIDYLISRIEQIKNKRKEEFNKEIKALL